MNHALRAELIRRSRIDQTMRNKAMVDVSLWDSSVDEENTLWLESTVRHHGWPTIAAVGEDASQAAWLLVQHADHRPDLQAECLEMMKHVPGGEIRLAHIAYLEDRVRVAEARPQLYGTQFYRLGDQFAPRQIEDEANLEARRAAMGLEAFEANRQRLIDQHNKTSRYRLS
jgi:hypothetical protein